MNTAELILNIICMSLFCVGVRATLDKGMIFSYLHNWWSDLSTKIENRENQIKLYKNELKLYFGTQKYLGKRIEIMEQINTHEFVWVWLSVVRYVLKPVLGCVICFASFWGTVCFILLNGTNLELWNYWLIACFSAAPLNWIIWKQYDK